MPGADRDLLVAGGGPSGLAPAILAAQAGMRVTVIEPKPGIIDKACGEGLMPAAVAALGRLGLPPQGGHPFIGVRYFWGSCMAEGRFSRGQGLGLRRLDLHAALRARAHALGVETVQDRVGDVQQDADGVRAAGLRAPYLVAADGLRSPVRAALGLDLPPRRPARVGLRRHFRVPPRAPFVEVHWSPLAEAYITPVGPDRVGLAFLMRQGQGPSPQGGSVYDALLASFPELQDWLGDAPVDSAVAGAGPFERRVRAPRLGRVLLVGMRRATSIPSPARACAWDSTRQRPPSRPCWPGSPSATPGLGSPRAPLPVDDRGPAGPQPAAAAAPGAGAGPEAVALGDGPRYRPSGRGIPPSWLRADRAISRGELSFRDMS